jgi:hypothetical protein
MEITRDTRPFPQGAAIAGGALAFKGGFGCASIANRVPNQPRHDDDQERRPFAK